VAAKLTRAGSLCCSSDDDAIVAGEVISCGLRAAIVELRAFATVIGAAGRVVPNLLRSLCRRFGSEADPPEVADSRSIHAAVAILLHPAGGYRA
jgi:hypothetical protein